MYVFSMTDNFPGRGITAYIVVYRDVGKIWGEFFDSNYKYGCGILAKIIKMTKYCLICEFELQVPISTTNPCHVKIIFWMLKTVSLS